MAKKRQRKYTKLVKNETGFHGPSGRIVSHDGNFSDDALMTLVEKNLKNQTQEECKTKRYIMPILRQRIVDLNNKIEERQNDDQTIADIQKTKN